MIEKIKTKWASAVELTKKANELVEQTNKITKTLTKLLKQAGWEEEDDKR